MDVHHDNQLPLSDGLIPFEYLERRYNFWWIQAGTLTGNVFPRTDEFVRQLSNATPINSTERFHQKRMRFKHKDVAQAWQSTETQ